MNFIDIVILIAVVLIVGLILFFNIRAMKNGENKCTKCPYSKSCTKCTCNSKPTEVEVKKNNSDNEK